MNLLTREQLISAFTPEDQPALSLPAFDHIPWDDLDYLGWCDRTGATAFCVFKTEDGPAGFVLDRAFIRTTNARSFMCSLCRTTHSQRGIASFSYKSRRGTGYHTLTDMFCADLQCSLYVRGILTPEMSTFFETIPVERKIERLHEGIDRFLTAIATFERRNRPRVQLRVV
jgi:FBP C-terminal treble-clef zinc-finger